MGAFDSILLRYRQLDIEMLFERLYPIFFRLEFENLLRFLAYSPLKGCLQQQGPHNLVVVASGDHLIAYNHPSEESFWVRAGIPVHDLEIIRAELSISKAVLIFELLV